MANSPEIGAGCRLSRDGELPGALESSQRVDAGRTGQLGAAEVEARNRKETFVGDDTCI